MYSLEALSLLGLRNSFMRPLHTYLLTEYNCPLRRACDVVSRHFSERYDIFHCLW